MPPLSTETDEQFMRRAIRLAMNGRGHVEPNPMVGCVIVKDGRVIGEGLHAQYGGPHAEPAALANCTEPPAGATAYVTLEPCCHTNKKTPPCAPRLIEAKLARVVIGCLDPNPDVNGRGVAMLRAAGIQVDGPVLEGPARQLIAPFFKKCAFRLPYVTLKWAESIDRRIAGAHGQRLQISGPEAASLVHNLRRAYISVLVGVNTVLQDDPLLTARGVGDVRGPTRVVLDTHLRLPLTSQLARTAEEFETVVYCASDVADARIAQYAEMGLLPTPVERDPSGRVSLGAALRDLGRWPMLETLVEAGPTTAKSFFASGEVDRVWVLRSPTEIGDDTAPRAAKIPDGFVATGQLRLGGDTLTEYLNPASPVFFALEPSADFILAGGYSPSAASSGA